MNNQAELATALRVISYQQERIERLNETIRIMSLRIKLLETMVKQNETQQS